MIIKSNARRSALAATLSAFTMVPTLAQAEVTLFDKDNWKIGFSGFVQTDLSTDSTRSFNEIVGDRPVEKTGSILGNNSRTQFSVRNSRFAFSVLPPVSDGWKTRGYMEMDFFGFTPDPKQPGGSEGNFVTNPELRIRHMFMTAESEGWSILAGQTWSLLGWQPAYIPATVTISPVPGVLFARIPQVTIIKSTGIGEANTLQTGLSVSRPVERDSRIPTLDAGLRAAFGGRRAAYAGASADVKAQPMSVAVSGSLREFAVPQNGDLISSNTNQLGSVIAFDAMIPVIASDDEKDVGNTLALSGEFTAGKGYGDQMVGFSGVPGLVNGSLGTNSATINPNLDSGQGAFDSTGTFQLVKLQTWNAQAQYHLPANYQTFITGGYGQTKSSNLGDIIRTPAAYDRAEVIFANVYHDFTKQIRLGLEIDQFKTHYVSDDSVSRNNRVQLSAWYRF